MISSIFGNHSDLIAVLEGFQQWLRMRNLGGVIQMLQTF